MWVLMAKNEAIESNPKTMTELKKELRRIVQSIVEDSSIEDENEFRFMELVEKSNKILEDLRVLKEGKNLNRRSSSFGNQSNKNMNNNGGTTSYLASCPQQFRCPLSKELMRDPVIISSGQTYDRQMIQEWLKSGNRTCPRTQEVLSHTILTPNHLIKDLITQWCKNHHVQFPNPLRYSDEYPLFEANRSLFIDQINKLSSTLSDQKEAAKKLRSLTKKTPSLRALFGESDEYLRQLLIPLSQSEINDDLQEDLITTLLNVSIHESNKKLVAETPMVISVLMDALRSGKIETRSNAAATLFTLSAIDSNKSLIGKAGALKPLFDLLENGQPLAIKDVASAIFSLCMAHENRSRAVKDGAVRVLLDKIVNRVHVDESLAILAMLSSNRKAIEEMNDFGAVSVLISLMKESNSELNKENCIAILYDICYNDRTKWKEMREEEKGYETLSWLVQNGTSRAKRKAGGLLDRIRGSVNRTHTT